jgi:hypothetical protein
MGRNLNRQDAKCAKETPDDSPEISFRASNLRFPSVWLGELGVLAVENLFIPDFATKLSLV